MKILWANAGFLHPTTRGGQIRTLGMLRELHRRHEIHYIALADPAEPEGPARAHEYAARVFPIPHRPTPKTSLRFSLDLAHGLFSPLPIAISRWRSPAMREQVAMLLREEHYDVAVCDFLVTVVNFPGLKNAVLFQHNVESIIWKRHADHARDAARRFYFRMQERRMLAFERDACLQAAAVISVSATDSAAMKRMFGVDSASIPTGVDLDYFRPPAPSPKTHGLVFVGSMDWMPNVDGVQWFLDEVLPLIRARRKDLPVTIVGRTPPASIRALAENDPHLHVTGTVSDVRPYFWGAGASIVHLRIGGGTRLKIYEAMAAGAPVISTAIGAEGLDVVDGDTIALADSAPDFARRCLELIDDPEARERMSRNAMELVRSRFSWERITEQFEKLLSSHAR